MNATLPKSSTTGLQDIDTLLKKLTLEKYITFTSNVPKNPKYEASSTADIAYQDCNIWNYLDETQQELNDIGFGSLWSNNDELVTCTKTVTHKIRAIRYEEDGRIVVSFTLTLMEFHIVKKGKGGGRGGCFLFCWCLPSFIFPTSVLGKTDGSYLFSSV